MNRSLYDIVPATKSFALPRSYGNYPIPRHHQLVSKDFPPGLNLYNPASSHSPALPRKKRGSPSPQRAGGRLCLRLQLIDPALGTYLRRGGHEKLQLRIREYDRTDITAIHHDAFRLSHLLLLSDQRTAHKA